MARKRDTITITDAGETDVEEQDLATDAEGNGGIITDRDLAENPEGVAKFVNGQADPEPEIDASADSPPVEPAPADDGGAAARMLARIFESADEGRSLREAYNARNDAAKAAKKRLESWQEGHEELEAKLQREYGNSPGPLFDGGADEPKGTATGEDDAWRSEPIRTLDLDSAVLKSIGEKAGETLGDFADWLQSHELTDLPGVGEATAEKIRDAWATFWAGRPATEAPASPAEPGDPAEVGTGAMPAEHLA